MTDFVPQIKIVTVATKESGYLKWLKESCIRNETELIILGMGEKWNGYITKIDLVNNFIKEQDDRDILCFIDAYDVIMLKNVNKLRNDFIRITNETNTRMIFYSPEDPNIGIKEIDDVIKYVIDTNFNVLNGSDHINAGFYMGYVKEIKLLADNIMKMYNETGEVDDERLLNLFVEKHKDISYIDNNYDFCCSPFDLIDRESYQEHSFFIHRIGNLPLTVFLVKHGYIVTTEDRMRLLIESIDTFTRKIPYHLANVIQSLIKK